VFYLRVLKGISLTYRDAKGNKVGKKASALLANS
jgi:hypothetical protein